jgi:molybdopterin biosynthesis enzyme
MSVHAKLQPPRRDARKRVLMVGTLITCDGSKRVRLRDFSSKGAQVVLEGGDVAKCDVLLKRGDLCAAARIAWIRGDEVGLTFYRELSPEDLAS